MLAAKRSRRDSYGAGRSMWLARRTVSNLSGFLLCIGPPCKFTSSFTYLMPVTTRKRPMSVESEAIADTTKSIHHGGRSLRSQQFSSISMVKQENDDSVANVAPIRTPRKRVKKEDTDTRELVTPSPPREESNAADSSKVSRSPPTGWEEIYSLVEELRQDRTAPCDGSGCEALPDRTLSPAEFRFQVLISLMLSSQTKDAVVGEAIRSMQRDKVLTVDGLKALPDSKLSEHYIAKVGFRNNKTKFIKQVVEILREKYDGDIPPTAAEMMELPGVGPKMAFICENVAWNKQTGIGVDTHMHRLFNLLRWVKSNNPEQTRVQLETWLPREKWADVNLLWVGFGQEVQQFKPRILRKALDCSRPADALRLLKRCGLDYIKEGRKLGLDEEIKAAIQRSSVALKSE